VLLVQVVAGEVAVLLLLLLLLTRHNHHDQCLLSPMTNKIKAPIFA
jgi:hypothetical protein